MADEINFISWKFEKKFDMLFCISSFFYLEINLNMYWWLVQLVHSHNALEFWN